MFDLIIILIILLTYLWWTGTITIPALTPSTAAPFLSTGNLEIDVDATNDVFKNRRVKINLMRVSKLGQDKTATVFNVFMNAVKKGKKIMSYSELSPSAENASLFRLLKDSPSDFFDMLYDLSMSTMQTDNINLVNQSNVSNLGLQIVNVPERTSQYNPLPPSTIWRRINRSRGARK